MCCALGMLVVLHGWGLSQCVFGGMVDWKYTEAKYWKNSMELRMRNWNYAISKTKIYGPTIHRVVITIMKSINIKMVGLYVHTSSI